ncbi:MAG: hypothetical protein ACI35P_00340 [Bacillus sp. (in: firmicutes)]
MMIFTQFSGFSTQFGAISIQVSPFARNLGPFIDFLTVFKILFG